MRTDTGSVEIRSTEYTLDQVLGSIAAKPGESPDFRAEIEQATAEEMQREFVDQR